MKKIMLILGAIIVSLTGFAQNVAKAHNPGPVKYCALEKEGKTVVFADKREITKDVTLENGAVVKPNGTIVKKDGTTAELKKGECVDLEGKISKEKEKEMKPEEMDKKKSY